MSRTLPKILLPFRPQGRGAPLFLMHSALGSTGYYAHLVRALDCDCPVYGINSIGLFGDAPPVECVREMAARYIDAMRAIYPRGPYIIGGHSSGAYTAFEVCLQLTPEEAPVCLIIDQAPPSHAAAAEPEPPTDLNHHVVTLITSIATLYVQALPATPANMLRTLEGQDDQAQVAQITRWLKELQFLPATATEDMATAFLGVLLANYMAAGRWSPGERRYGGQLALLRVSESRLPLAVYERWQKNCAREIRVLDVPGNHATLMARPYVDTLGALVRQVIEAPQ